MAGILSPFGAGFVNPMTTAGDLIDGGLAGAAQRLPVGGNGQVLTVAAGTPSWQNSAAGFANPMTTAGDLIDGGLAGAAQRLPIGVNGQGLLVVTGAPSWGTVLTSLAAADTSIAVGGTAAAPTLATGTLDVIATNHPPAANWSNNSKKITSLANGSAASDAAAFGQTISALLTTAGDLAIENATPALARLPIGTAGQVLTVSGGLPSWQAPSGSSPNVFRFTNAGTTASIPNNGLITGMSWQINANTLAVGNAFLLLVGNGSGGGAGTMGLFADTVSGTQSVSIAPPGTSPIGFLCYLVVLSTGATGSIYVANIASDVGSLITLNTTVNQFIEVFNKSGAAQTYTGLAMIADSL